MSKNLLRKKLSLNKPRRVVTNFQQQCSSPEISSSAIMPDQHEHAGQSPNNGEQVVQQVNNESDQQQLPRNIVKNQATLIKIQPINNDDDQIEGKYEDETEINQEKNQKQQIKRNFRKKLKTQEKKIIFDFDDSNNQNQQKIQTKTLPKRQKVSSKNFIVFEDDDLNINDSKKQTVQTANQSNLTNKQEPISHCEQISEIQVIQLQKKQQKLQQKKSQSNEIENGIIDKIKISEKQRFPRNQQLYYYESKNTQEYFEEQDDQEYESEDDEISEQQQDMRGDQISNNSSHKEGNAIQILKAETLTDLLFTHVPKNCSIQCIIVCRKSFFSKSRSYDLYLRNEKQYLVTAIKNRIKLTSQFQLKNNPYKNENAETLATLKSNFSGLEYNLTLSETSHTNPIQLLHVEYSPNLLGLSNRSICITQNCLHKKIRPPEIVPFSMIKNYIQIEKNPKHLEYFKKFEARKPQKNKDGQFQMDYHNVAKFPSPNNLIIQDQAQNSLIIVGKVTDNAFGLKVQSFKSGFSLGQAFCIAVSSLDSKLFVR